MDNRSINELPIKRFNKETTKRTMRGFEGNSTGIRSINPHDKVDMQRMQSINLDDSEFLLGDPLTEKELREWADYKKSDEGMVFAVAKGNPDDPKDWGEMQGWIFFYNDEDDRVIDMKENGIVDGEDPHVIEVSYAKVPGAENGQMGQGLRQACAEFARRDAMKDATREHDDRAKFAEKMSQSNLDLDASRLAWQKFDDEMLHKYNRPSTVLTAYVRPENAPSIKMLERSGFVRKDKIKYAGFEEDHQDHLLFVLDWDLLHARLQEDADKSLLDKISKLSQSRE